MKKNFNEIEAARVIGHPILGSKTGDRTGAFVIGEANHNGELTGTTLSMTVDDGAQTGWEHVAVEASKLEKKPGQKRGGPEVQVSCQPTWEHMQAVKDFFWGKDETVLQFHPANERKGESNVLHLWRKVGEDAELPLELESEAPDNVTDFKQAEAVEDEVTPPDSPNSDGEPV